MSESFIIGGVYAYKDEYINKVKTDNMVILGFNDSHVVCVPICLYEHWLNGAVMGEETRIGKYTTNEFKKWYPKFLSIVSN